MKVIALLSGGKDSVLALLMAYRYRHEPVVVANIIPAEEMQENNEHEVDSYMYQTVGHEAVTELVECLGLPLRRGVVHKHRAVDQSLHYSDNFSENDEVEDLYRLLKGIKEEFPEVEGVTSGAILSNYQRHRVEFVCYRLGLRSVAYLWRRQPREILDMASALHVKAILVKTASAGLIPQKLLGQTLEEARPILAKMEQMYGGHMAGEGGEFETLVLEAPLFEEEQLEVVSLENVIVDDNDYSPSGHCVVSVKKVPKTETDQSLSRRILSNLRDGLIQFPSDMLPSLPQTTLTFTISSDCVELKENATELTFIHNYRNGLIMHLKDSVTLNTMEQEAVAAAVTSFFRSFFDTMDSVNAVPFYFLITASTTLLFDLIDNIYVKLVPTVRSPGRTLIHSPAKNGSTEIQIVALYTSKNTCVDVVHNQSLSCWAAGSFGPFSQAWNISSCKETETPDHDLVQDVVVASGYGNIPYTGTPATQHDVWNSGVEVRSNFEAQFAFAFANAAQYGSLFRKYPEDAANVTFFVADASNQRFLRDLWRWCCPKVKSSAVFECFIGRMSEGKEIEIFLEWND